MAISILTYQLRCMNLSSGTFKEEQLGNEYGSAGGVPCTQCANCGHQSPPSCPGQEQRQHCTEVDEDSACVTALLLLPYAEMVWCAPQGSRREEQKEQRRVMEKALQEEYAARRVRTVDEQGRAYATGKRKASIARVWIWEGPGQISINGRRLDMHFHQLNRRLEVLSPFQAMPGLLLSEKQHILLDSISQVHARDWEFSLSQL